MTSSPPISKIILALVLLIALPLNDIKPAMIKEATVNAFDAETQLADDSGAHVGGIINASQGVFSITGRDGIDSISPSMQLHKKVRVVNTVTYRIE